MVDQNLSDFVRVAQADGKNDEEIVQQPVPGTRKRIKDILYYCSESYLLGVFLSVFLFVALENYTTLLNVVFSTASLFICISVPLATLLLLISSPPAVGTGTKISKWIFGVITVVGIVTLITPIVITLLATIAEPEGGGDIIILLFPLIILGICMQIPGPVGIVVTTWFIERHSKNVADRQSSIIFWVIRLLILGLLLSVLCIPLLRFLSPLTTIHTDSSTHLPTVTIGADRSKYLKGLLVPTQASVPPGYTDISSALHSVGNSYCYSTGCGYHVEAFKLGQALIFDFTESTDKLYATTTTEIDNELANIKRGQVGFSTSTPPISTINFTYDNSPGHIYYYESDWRGDHNYELHWDDNGMDLYILVQPPADTDSYSVQQAINILSTLQRD